MLAPTSYLWLGSPGLATCVLLGTALAAGAWRYHQMGRYARIGERLAQAAVAFECSAGEDAPRVLVVGDSTAVGTGAERPEDSLAGQLSAQFPHVSIVNRARNGARTIEAIAQLNAEGGASYALVLIHVGANDVMRRTPLRELRPQVDTLIERARRLSEHVIVTTTPNVGLVPAFFPPFSWWLSRRSRQVGALFEAAAARHGAHCCSFFHRRASDPFRRERKRYYAPDRLHPSTACYRYAYQTLVSATPIATALARHCDPISVRTSMSSGKNVMSSA